MYSVCLTASKVSLSEYVEAGFTSDLGLRSHKYTDGSDFRLLFFRGRLSNIQSFTLIYTCRTIVFLIKSFVSPRSCCCCRHGLLKVPNIVNGMTNCKT